MTELKDYMMRHWSEGPLPWEHGAGRVIEDSISQDGVRVTTFEIVLWRPMLAENNTHRANVKNCASSRARPLRSKPGSLVPGTLDIIEQFPGMPLKWGSEKPGMQSGAELEGKDRQEAEFLWLTARDNAVEIAERMADLGLHKSLINRILEPFMWVNIVQTSTSWQNMFNQRCMSRTDQAQAEMAIACDTQEMLLDWSTPKLLLPGEWHVPFILESERDSFSWGELKRMSSARCARTSYMTHDLKLDPNADFGLFEKLRDARPMHASPFEHVCTPLGALDKPLGCLRGFRQFRHELEFAAGIDSSL